MQDRPWTRSSLPQVDAFVTMTKDLPSLHIFILLSLVLNTLHVFGISGDSKMSANWGQGLSQNDLMERDTVLVVDNDDNVIGSASKKDSHVFNENQPHGILHRAFSIFIFDESDGRLLLHQRSADKITFPNVRMLSVPFALILVLAHKYMPSFLYFRYGQTRAALILCMV